MCEWMMCAMDRFYVYLGAVVLGLGPSLLGCIDDVVPIPQVDESAACARGLSKGYWNDGTHRVIGADRHVCLCITEDEFESMSRVDELNQMLLEDCRDQSALYGFDWDDCDEDYAAKEWIGPAGERVTWPTDHGVNPPGSQVVCGWRP